MVNLDVALEKCAELYGEDRPFLSPESGTLTLAGCKALCRLGIGFSGNKFNWSLLHKIRNNLSDLE
ncbi:hypothetical protein FHQ28_11695 [Pasteurellaceae bacterium USgator11]|nr:hypothetical protein FHQ20_10960 [Pasteurellaceae bacterium USgator41]TNG92038.1 hypothetical protein FHQ19_12335 [Pasteurellaceae bacterium UScroc12]TNG98823.1 hypothetical protein FHQ28_11695 [Pasteurellaceae bacterium USgator11]TNG99198.1 hypothetical protein FHQ24_06545 [Pasteurellaceae bacterium UScroc31]